MAALSLGGCGRLGFGTEGGRGDGGGDLDGTAGSADSSSGDATPLGFDAAADALDAAPTCATEILLGSSTITNDAGGFGSPISQVSLTFSPSSPFAHIGRGLGLGNGYSGDTELRASNDDQFVTATTALMTGSATAGSLGVLLYPSGGGATVTRPISPAVAGTTITMVKQRVASLSLTPDAGGTDYVASVTWELWGCQ